MELNESGQAKLIPIYIVFAPEKKQHTGEIIRRENKSFHYSRESALLGQNILDEKTEIEDRMGVQFDGLAVFLIDRGDPNGHNERLMADEDALREEVRARTIAKLSDAQLIALGLPQREKK